MKKLPHPGSLDTRYEGKGQAPIPGHNSAYPDCLFQVMNATALVDGSVLSYGHSYGDPERPVFVQLDSQGRFVSELGHVEVPSMYEPPALTFALNQFVELVHLGAAHEGDTLALSLPFQAADDCIYSSLAIGRYTATLKPKKGFGDNGIQFVPHSSASDAPHGLKRAAPDVKPPRRARRQDFTYAITPLDLPRAALIDKTLKVIYRETASDTFGLVSASTYLAHFEADSGKPLECYRIVIEGQAPLLYDAAFLQNGKALLLGQVGNTAYLARLTSKGVIDQTFGTQGLVELPDPGYLGLATDGQRIVVTHAPPWQPAGYASTVYQYTSEGQFDPDFNGGTPLKVAPSAPADTLRLYRAAFDGQGNIVLAGAQGKIDSGIKSSLCVVRLRASGTLDTGFGDGGYALGPDGLISGDGLYVHQDGIRLLTQAYNADCYIVKRHV